MKKILELSKKLLSEQHFDSLAVGVIDFKQSTFKSLEITASNVVSEIPYLYFDLASLTKALTNSVVSLIHPEIFDADMLLLLNHKAGITMGGRIRKDLWKEQMFSFPIKKSDTVYSDYSSLRCMLEIEKRTGKKLKDLCSFYFDEKMKYWFDLPENAFCPETGMRNKQIICCEVHDDNCFNIKDFVSHAGLFATIDGLCQSLINLNQKVDLIKKMDVAFKNQNTDDRFIQGFDRVMNPNETLAGAGCSHKTFGHLGFTGTSFWIDIEKMRGSVILTNATQSYWYERAGLTKLRKTIGSSIWNL